MKKLFTAFACIAVVLVSAFAFTGCTKRGAITYAISFSCSDSIYGDNLAEYFRTSHNGNTYTIEAINETGNFLLNKSTSQNDSIKLNIYLTNSSEKFYRASFARSYDNRRVSGLSTRMQDVIGSQITLSIACPDATKLTGSNAIVVNIAQGSISGVCALNEKGKKAVEMDDISLVVEVIPYDANRS